MRSVPRRLRLSSTARCTYSGLAPFRCSSTALPNFVATTTSSRRRPSARPRYSSLLVPPYTSAVSKKLMPASSAASTTADVASESRRRPKLLQPRPTIDTSSDPIRRVSIGSLSPVMLIDTLEQLADQVGQAINLIQFRNRGPTDHLVRAHVT